MKCQKCAKPAVVHLTDVITGHDGTGMGESRKAVEMHLCLQHAVEAGLLTPTSETQAVAMQPEEMQSASAGGGGLAKKSQEEIEESAIVPAPSGPSSLAVSRGRGTPTDDPLVCPVCGIHWSQFKQGGLMGCPHDYEQFGSKLGPLLKRAQEGATEHVGKVPAKKKTPQGDRQVMMLRLKRELQQAVDVENYEQAAKLRDLLRQLEQG